MRRRGISWTIIWIGALPLGTWEAPAEDVAILVSKQVAPYAEAASGAREALSGVSVIEIDLPERADKKEISRKLDAAGVKVVLSVGRSATQLALDLGQRPVIYCMVLDAAEIDPKATLAGVHLQVPVSAQLEAFHGLVPAIKKVAALYDPVHSSDIVDQAQADATALGIGFLPVSVGSIKEVFSALRSLRAQGADALWMVPDPTVYNRDSMQSILRFTIENKLPFMASDKEIVRSGALCALSARFASVGAQAAAMVKAALAGASVADLPIEPPSDYGLYVNTKTGSLIQASLAPSALSSAVEAYR